MGEGGLCTLLESIYGGLLFTKIFGGGKGFSRGGRDPGGGFPPKHFKTICNFAFFPLEGGGITFLLNFLFKNFFFLPFWLFFFNFWLFFEGFRCLGFCLVGCISFLSGFKPFWGIKRVFSNPQKGGHKKAKKPQPNRVLAIFFKNLFKFWGFWLGLGFFFFKFS